MSSTTTLSRAPRSQRAPVPAVTAVLVAHQGAAWLPRVLQALACSTVQPDHLVLVDTGSTDATPDLLAALGPVLRLPQRSGFGAAVTAGLQAAPRTPWVWLLHDDAAPDPGALEALLAEAARTPSAALLGPKAVDWEDPHLLVEVGLTADRGGGRGTGIDRGERDQGQHDAVQDVLAVGTAGALVRRDALDAVGGLNARLPLLRDDLDLGWRLREAGHRVVVVPAARVAHARATTTGRRQVHAVRGRLQRVDRRHALLVLLAHAPLWRVLPDLLAAVVGGVLRAALLLLTRQPVAATDSLLPVLAVLLRPDRLLRLRWTGRGRTVPRREASSLLIARRARLRAGLAAAADRLARGAEPPAVRAAEPTGAVLEQDSTRPRPAPPLLARPAVLLATVLLAVAVVAERGLFGGALSGGRLLPVPDGAADLWRGYAQAGPVPAPPSLAVLGALSAATGGRAPLALALAVLLAVPLAGLLAFVAVRPLVQRPLVAVAAAATWALLPVATGAVAAGRLDAVAGQLAVPLLLRAGARLLTTTPRRRLVPQAALLGLGLAVLGALNPLLAALLAALLLLGPLLRLPASGRVWRCGAALLSVGLAAACLGPWLPALAADPGLLVRGPGAPLAEAAVPPWRLLVLDPGGAAAPTAGLAAGVLAAALAALLTRDRRVPAGWTVAATGLAAALVLDRSGAWPGAGLQVAAAGLLVAGTAGGDGLRAALARRRFGWRQPLAGLLVLAAAAAPLALAATWVQRGAGGPLQSGAPALALPAFAAAELARTPGARALLLRPHGPAAATYALVGPGGGRLGDAELQRSDPALDALVADLLTPRGSLAAQSLAVRGVRLVAAPGGVAAVLDAAPGLVRAAAGGPLLLWRVLDPADRLAVLPPATAAQALAGAAARTGARPAPPVLPPGPPGRLLVLTEPAGTTWQASLDGRRLPGATAHGSDQAWPLPATGGRLVVRRDQRGRTRALLGQGAAVAVALLLALPPWPRRRDLDLA